MDHLMTTEDSYAERRQLFKNIWQTAMDIEGKDADIMKPKVIKTLRLDEVDRFGVNKRKKLKLKNLRHVCNKILDFCDRQEADDLYYEQINAEGHKRLHQIPKIDLKTTKVKNCRIKKKTLRSKSLSSPARSPAPKATTSERKDEFRAASPNKVSRNTSPIKVKKTSGKIGHTSQKPSATIKKSAIAKGKKNARTTKYKQGRLVTSAGT